MSSYEVVGNRIYLHGFHEATMVKVDTIDPYGKPGVHRYIEIPGGTDAYNLDELKFIVSSLENFK